MKTARYFFATLITAVLFLSCKKEGFITSTDALLRTSVDTLHFDTVFTTTGSITQLFKIFNGNDKKLNLSSVKLMGGNSSAFKMNVDGLPGTSFSNIEIAPNDSVYVFVSVSINQSTANLPFIVQDSVQINYNGNTRWVQLDAFGRNANFYRNRRITTDSTWNNDKPFVILGSLLVDSNVVLTINKGCKIYSHADAPIIVNGTLRVLGEKYDSTRVTFKGDRLDYPYNEFPGSWPGIYFNRSSRNNILNYATIQHAYQGVVAINPNSLPGTKLTLNECIIDNIYDGGIIGSNSSIMATNCLISNCGYNVFITAGGNYNFNHCTISSYGNSYLSHKNPVLTVGNSVSQTTTNPLTAIFRNSIFYGEGGTVDDEVLIDKKGSTAFSVTFDNVLYKVKTDPTNATFNNSLKNQVPQFDSIDIGRRYFNFRLKSSSPAINKGIATGVLFDLDRNPRIGLPDIGCFEKQ
jgi:hypothetical protein